MSRRDTIIVAVLVNAGLLMVLFATAMRPKEGPTPQTPALAKQSRPAPEPKKVQEVVLPEELSIAVVVDEPAPVAVPKVKEEGQFAQVTVKQGDMLEKIARANNTTVSALMKANSLTSTTLKVGQVLRVPLSKGEAAPPKAPVQQEGEFYIVKEGDSPWLIASKNNIRLDELLRLNGLDDQKARRLRPGDRLKIR